MDRATQTGIMIIATAVVVAGLVYFAGPLTQFALALLLFFGISGFARWLRKRTRAPAWLATATGMVVVLAIVGVVGLIIGQNVGRFVERAPEYEARLNQLVRMAHLQLGLSPPAPTVDQLFARFNLDRLLAETVAGVQSVIGDAVFVLIYLGFIFAAARGFSEKLDNIFANPADRWRSKEVLTGIRHAMEQYIWTQTVISLLTSVLTYITLSVIGLENALFWSFVIFFLNYIPTIGSIVAAVIPTLVALVQFDDIAQVAAVGLGVGFWQFVIGNFIQPRVMGDSLNLSALVVLLGLAVWGLIWGIAGAFLSAPLTVMAMIILAQFPSTRWIAVLLSADGLPCRESVALTPTEPVEGN